MDVFAVSKTLGVSYPDPTVALDAASDYFHGGQYEDDLANFAGSMILPFASFGITFGALMRATLPNKAQ